VSLEESIKFEKMILKAFPDSSWTTEELFAVGDRVIARWTYKGTHEGDIMGIPPTGNKLEFGGISITRIENGKIVEGREDYDTLGLMQQLGFELKPKEEK
jgi:predicted ester cyclase